MTEFTARATRWARGWELHVEGVGVTQVRTLDQAEQQVRDLIATMAGESADDAEIAIDLPDLQSYVDRINHTREAADRAAAEAVAAAMELRTIIGELRDNEGLSVSDLAALLGISRGRVSQLVGHRPRRSVNSAQEAEHG